MLRSGCLQMGVVKTEGWEEFRAVWCSCFIVLQCPNFRCESKELRCRPHSCQERLAHHLKGCLVLEEITPILHPVTTDQWRRESYRASVDVKGLQCP